MLGYGLQIKYEILSKSLPEQYLNFQPIFHLNVTVTSSMIMERWVYSSFGLLVLSFAAFVILSYVNHKL